MPKFLDRIANGLNLKRDKPEVPVHPLPLHGPPSEVRKVHKPSAVDSRQSSDFPRTRVDFQYLPQQKPAPQMQMLSLISDPQDEPVVAINYNSLKKASRPLSRHRAAPTRQTRLIIGIDFGTTQSGVAYSRIGPDTTTLETKDVFTVVGWSGERNEDKSAPKVSSSIAYNDEGAIRWGFDIPAEGWDKLQWIKILLEPDSPDFVKAAPEVRHARRLLEKRGLSAIDVVGDFLRCLWEHARKEIIKNVTEAGFRSAKKTIVLSVPASWSHKAHHNTYTAAVLAGLASDDLELKLITEPGAAALAVMKDPRDTANDLKKGDCFVICDAGGGTVDLISFQVGDVNPVRLSERVQASGALCGSVFLDSKFMELVSVDIGPEIFADLPVEIVANMATRFELQIKRQFKLDTDKDKVYYVELDRTIPDVEMVGKRLVYKPDSLHAIFDPICTQIDDLITAQISELKRKGYTAKLVILVGGFGENDYLWDRLLEDKTVTYKKLGNGDGSSISAVAKGAVLSEYIGLTTVFDVFVSRHHIGRYCTRHEEFDHPGAKRCPFRGTYFSSTYEWFVHKDQDIRTRQESRFPFFKLVTQGLHEVDNDEPEQKIRLLANLALCDEDVAPLKPSHSVRRFVDVEFEVDPAIVRRNSKLEKGLENNMEYRMFFYEVVMIMGPAKLEFNCAIAGELVGESKSVLYVE